MQDFDVVGSMKLVVSSEQYRARELERLLVDAEDEIKGLIVARDAWRCAAVLLVLLIFSYAITCLALGVN